MAKYNVHIYALVRVEVSNVSAPSPRAAAKKAANKTDLYTAFHAGEYAEEIAEFMVDRVDAEQFTVATHNMNGDYKPIRR